MSDDDAYDDVVRRAEKATRLGWTAIAGVTGLLLLALVAAIALLLATAVAMVCLMAGRG
ncbi:hypothetical protein [Streptomyces sp. enrichment culture]|uniref:hypothetical protein n=1 Tax=Streptomyces sp. enrichment culture TaxID=1795815 RepID=UPI003F5718D7